MFEAELQQGKIVKMLVEAMKELVSEGNLDCSKSGISLQVRRCARSFCWGRKPHAPI